jgi:OmpA-OmpF porin, OOP family
MFCHPSSRAAALAAAVSLQALLLSGSALAQTVQMFEQAPSIEELRKILIPETRPGGLSRKIEIPHRGSVAPAPMIQPAATVSAADGPGSAPAAPPSPPAATAPAAAAPAPVAAAPAAPAPAAPAPAAIAATPPKAVEPTVMAARPGDDVPMPKAAGVADAVGFRINFALNSAVIPPVYESYIDSIGALMQQEPALKLLVEGHTDALGSDQYNNELSERRAVAVARHLVLRHNIDPERLQVAGKGKSEPLMRDAYDPRNRRVQFLRTE